MKVLALIFLTVGAAVLTDGYFQPASAQCPADVQIYIDPRLVPQRQSVTPEQFRNILVNPEIPENVKNYWREAYRSQYQPIQIPFRAGSVLISPTDPCIQQYIGR